MGRTSQIQNSFNAGEWSQVMIGRTDLERSRAALQTSLNAFPWVQGMWSRRPGLAFLHQVKNNDETQRLIPFQHVSGDNYVLEVGAEYIRVFVDNGITVNTGQSITSITQANPGVVTKVAHGYSDGDRLELYDFVGMEGLNGREVVVTTKTADTFEVYDTDGNAIDTTDYAAFTSGNMAEIFEITTPFAEADLPYIRFVQTDDTIYLLHEDYECRLLTRASVTSWTLATADFTDGPYLSTNTTTTTLSPSAATGTVTITASAVDGINDGDGFKSTDVGRAIRMSQGGTWGWAEIVTYSSSVAVTAVVYETLTNTNAKTNWRLGAWSDTTGWPRTGAFLDDRLWLGGPTNYPQRVDASKVGDSNYTNFSPSATDGTVADDNAISYPLNSAELNKVRWMEPTNKGLAIGTSAAEWLLRGASATDEVITPSNAKAKPSTYHGSDTTAPIRIGSVVLFFQRGSRKLREFSYTFERDSYTAPDLSLYAEHIPRPGITEMAIMKIPQTIVWSVRSDGALIGFTYERDQNVTAWHRHTIGGYSDAAGTAAAKVEAIAVVPSADGTRDTMYAVVNRYINGGTKRYIEYMTKFWETGDTQANAVHLDCAWTQITTAAKTNSVTQLHHVEGESMTVYVDGKALPNETVTNATLTTGVSGYVITVGYNYNSDGETLPLEGGTPDGTAQGKTKQINRIGFWLVDTLGLKFGNDATDLEEYLVRQWGDDYGVATELFSGVVRQSFPGNSDRLGVVYWRCDGPFPGNISAIMPQATVSDDT